MQRVISGLAVVVIVIVIAAPSLGAWSGQGHRLVGLIAMERLTPFARKQVAWLLDGRSLADVANWADTIRSDQQQTYGWHFLNIPPGAAGYDRDRDCPRAAGVDSAHAPIAGATARSIGSSFGNNASPMRPSIAPTVPQRSSSSFISSAICTSRFTRSAPAAAATMSGCGCSARPIAATLAKNRFPATCTRCGTAD